MRAARIDVPLVGRDPELAAIRKRLTRAAAGTREALLLEGEAGIGKTRLISECISHARDCGLNVVHGAGDDTERERPCGLILTALQASAPDLAGRLGPLPTDVAARRLAIVDALVSIVDDVSQSAPVALILDDLHWADAETLRALRSLVRRTASMPFVFVGTCRPAANPDLEALIEMVVHEGLHIDLQPLDDDAVSTLVGQLVVDSSSKELLARAASARGNPFFVIEIVTSGLDELPSDLRRTVLQGTIQLAEDARSVLRIASLFGAAVDPEELSIVTGRTVLDLLGPLDEAVKARVLEDRDGSLGFRHELVREAIYGDMPKSVRKKLHQDAARALVASGAAARRVAVHLGAVADPGDGEAISWLRRAAAEEMQRAPKLSADLLRRVAELMDSGDPLIEGIHAERVQALTWAGQVADAVSLASRVLGKMRDQTLAASVRASLGEASFFQGRISTAAELLESAAADASDSESGFLLAEAAIARVGCAQFQNAEELARRAMVQAASTNDPRAHSLSLSVQSMLSVLRGDPAAPDLAREAVRVADEDFLDEAHHYGPHLFLGFALTAADRFDEAIEALREGRRRQEARGVGWSLSTYYVTRGLQYFERGDWGNAVAELETMKVLLDDMGSVLLGPMAHGLQANIAVHRGDAARALEEIERGEAQVADAGPQIGFEWLLHARILLLESGGDVASAFAATLSACRLAQAMGFRFAFRYYCPTLVRLASATGALDECRFAVEGVEAFAESTRIPSNHGIALMCRGTIEADAAKMLEAVSVLRNSPRPLERAMAHEQAGIGLARAREFEAAAEQFQEAFAMYEGLGAQLDVARTTEALRAAGGHRKRARPVRPVSGWGSLSPTERRVTDLVAEGLSNGAVAERLVVSRRTVETHVYHVFQKLGVSSRAELATRASREAAAEEAR
jgi:ATP/maltotriose-dependent transcriptional regulator MalT